MPAVAVWAEPPAMPAIGQVRVTRVELDLLDIEAEAIRGDLGERRPRALAHVMRAGLASRPFHPGG